MAVISDRSYANSQMNALIKSPRFFIGIQMAILLIAGCITGLFQVRLSPDSFGYIAISKMSLPEMMGTYRTLAYPLLIRGVASVSPNYQLMPWIHLAIFFFSVYFFDYALRCYGASPWQAFAASCGFFYAAILYVVPRWLIHQLLTDYLAQIMAIISVSCLLLLVCNNKQYKIWCFLGLSLMISYHLRPDYVFFISVIPCIGSLFLWFHRQWTSEPYRWKGFLASLCGVSILPFLGYCLLRWYVVGQFGLVSIAGWSSSGFATEIIDEKMVETELSEQYRPLAREILQKRQKLGMSSAFHGNWVNNMKQWHENVSNDYMKITLPIASQMYGKNFVTINRELGGFSREVIGLRKGKYLLLLVYIWFWAAANLLRWSWTIQALLSLALLLWFLRRYLSRKHSFHPLSEQEDIREIGLLRAFFCAATLFFFGKVFPSLLITFVDARYVIPTSILFSSYLALLSFRELKIIQTIRNMHGAKNV